MSTSLPGRVSMSRPAEPRTPWRRSAWAARGPGSAGAGYRPDLPASSGRKSDGSSARWAGCSRSNGRSDARSAVIDEHAGRGAARDRLSVLDASPVLRSILHPAPPHPSATGVTAFVLVDILLVVVLARILGTLANRFGQPRAVGEIIA